MTVLLALVDSVLNEPKIPPNLNDLKKQHKNQFDESLFSTPTQFRKDFLDEQVYEIFFNSHIFSLHLSKTFVVTSPQLVGTWSCVELQNSGN